MGGCVPDWSVLSKQWLDRHNRIMRLVEMEHRDEVPSIWRNDKLISVESLPDISHYEE